MALTHGFGGFERQIQWLSNAEIAMIELYFYETEFLLQALGTGF
jgi:hypothetical protein